MKTLRVLLSSFRVKVTLSFVLALLFVVVLSNLLIYRFSIDSQFNQLRNRLKVIAQTASLLIDGEMLRSVPLSKEGIDSPQYKTIFNQLKKIKEANPYIRYVYTMVMSDEPGVLRFVVDLDPLVKAGKRKATTAFPGDRYQARRFPAMLQGFQESSVDSEIVVDEWGSTISGYAPIRNAQGEVVAIIGLDMLAEDVRLMYKEMDRRFFIVFAMSLVLAVFLGFLISNMITGRVSRLVEGTRRIAAEDLDYKVDVKGHDEISELAGSFNKMASSLSESRMKLQDYFFRVVQSLVRILEAKDQYTSGHSERVSQYAEMIARQMGFSKEKCEVIKKTAELHDIGKLVIYESILNKKGKLTDSEWKMIQEHPVLGADVLKPVLLDDDIMSMIRSHHERYDGTGYPDKIKGDNINIFAQIVSVADAYDAMTSNRAYRESRSKEAALDELLKSSGTQFNTQIVKAFIKALEGKPEDLKSI